MDKILKVYDVYRKPYPARQFAGLTFDEVVAAAKKQKGAVWVYKVVEYSPSGEVLRIWRTKKY